MLVRRSPRPLRTAPFSVSEFSFDSLLASLWKSPAAGGDDDNPFGVGPRTAADAVPGVDGRLAAAGRRAQVHSRQVRPPAPAPSSQRLTMRIGSGETAEVRALARTCAGYK